jgi:hypothetical protein
MSEPTGEEREAQDGAKHWIATTATITACRYQSRGLSTLAFGFQTGEKFAISFDYYAHGQLYSGEFQSPIAIPQSETIPIAYNPLNPSENSRAIIPSAGIRKPPLLAVGIAGSIILSFAWLAILRGCH